jgi:5,10-methylenetetrahydromethanopterin reductase
LLTASGPRLLELAGEVADGALMLMGLHPDSVAAAREHLRIGAHRAVGEAEAVGEWPPRWFRPDQPWLEYPSRSNLRYVLRETGAHSADDLAEGICDAFGLFGGAEHCAERLIRAHEEAGIDHAFLFPAHTFETGCEMPRAEVEAFGRVIRPRLEA